MNNRTLLTSQCILPSQANLIGKAHGGEIMKLMDSTAGALAIKYSRGTIATARVDELEFLHPIPVGALVTCAATIDYVGTTSMEVFVLVEMEELAANTGPQKALSAYFTMVAIDEHGRPRKIDPYTPQTDEEIKRYEEAKSRRMMRDERRNARKQKDLAN